MSLFACECVCCLCCECADATERVLLAVGRPGQAVAGGGRRSSLDEALQVGNCGASKATKPTRAIGSDAKVRRRWLR
jgi:hypothetical protein